MHYWYLWIIEIILTMAVAPIVISYFEIKTLISQIGIAIIIFIIIVLIIKKVSKISIWAGISEKEVPRWVWKSYYRWERKLPHHPYNMVAYFKGKHQTYKVVHGMEGQGQAPIIGWYVKKRRR